MNELIQAAAAIGPQLHVAVGGVAPIVAAATCASTAAGACIGSLIGQVQPWVAAGIPLVAGYTLFQRYPKSESHAMLIAETGIGVFAFEALWNIVVPIMTAHLA